MKLYKYRTINQFSLDIARNQRLFLSLVSELNDPYDVLIKSAATMHKIEYYTDDQGNRLEPKYTSEFWNINGDLAKKKVCALSSLKDSVLMWSHYSNSHKGIVFEIEVDDKYIHKINYISEENFFKETDNFCEKLKQKTITEEDWNLYYRYKVKEWEYEEEYRIIENGKEYFNNFNLTGIILGRDYLKNGIYELLLLKEILKFNDEIKLEKLVINVWKKEIIKLSLEEVLIEIEKRIINILR